MTSPRSIRVGCAGIALPSPLAPPFLGPGSRLERYARVFDVLEINSTFYRVHRPSTFARWSEQVPATFRFAVKMPKTITHERRFLACAKLLSEFLEQVNELGQKLGPILIQLAKSHPFDEKLLATFLERMRRTVTTPIVLEVRHLSFGDRPALAILRRFSVTTVTASPRVLPVAPEETSMTVYHRLHGEPRMYWSGYDAHALNHLARTAIRQRDEGHDVYCVFDNTAGGFAPGDAITLQRLAA